MGVILSDLLLKYIYFAINFNIAASIITSFIVKTFIFVGRKMIKDVDDVVEAGSRNFLS